MRGRLRSDEGFSLIEAVVALGLAAILILSLTYSLINGLNSLRAAKQFQQATALGTDAIERMRNLGFGVALTESDPTLVGDTRVAGTTFVPTGEPLATISSITNTLNPHTTVATVDNETYTISRYVTSAGEAKRLVVYVDWFTGAAPHSYTASTLMSPAARGLPSSSFTLAAVEQVVTCAPPPPAPSPLTECEVGFDLTNNGPNDNYDITSTMSPVQSGWVVTVWLDTNGNRSLDSGDQNLSGPPVNDTDGNGNPNTGSVALGTTITLFVRWQIGTLEPERSFTLTLGAASGISDPGDPGRFREASTSVSVKRPRLDLYLHALQDSITSIATSAVTEAWMNPDPPVTAQDPPPNYSTDLHAAPGRFLAGAVPTPDESDPRFMANWVLQMPVDTTIVGNVTMTIWVAQRDLACTNTVNASIYLRDRTDLSVSTGTLISTGAIVSPPPLISGVCPFRPVTVVLPVNNYTLLANRYLALKVVLNVTSLDSAVLAYDTTIYQATVSVPISRA